MGTKNLVMLKTHIDSINLCFANDFVYENVLWALASLWVFFCNYVIYSMGLILRYIFRFQVEDRKKEHLVPLSLAEQTKRNELEDFEIGGFAENLANLLFPRCEDFHVASEEIEGETESSVLLEIDSDIHEESKKREGEKDCSVLKEKDSDEKKEVEAEGSVLETDSVVHEDVKKINETEKDCSVFIEGDSNFQQDGREKDKKEEVEKEEEEKEGSVIMDNGFATTTSKCKFIFSKDISVFVDEPTTMTFTFHIGENVSGNIVKQEFSEHNLEEGLVAQEEEESVQEQRTFISNSSSDRFHFESNAFEANEASDDDYVLYNDNLLPSDSDSESSSSSSLMWGNNNNNNTDDSLTNQILSSSISCEGFESESLNTIEDNRVEEMEETQFLYDRQVSHGLGGKTKDKNEKEGSVYHEAEENRDSLEKNEEPMWEDELDELDFDDEDEDEDDEDDDFEWENDEVVEQLRLEVRNARQGGLATILEDEEDEETESPKVVEDLKPLKLEEKIQYKDHIVEIQKVYRSYAEKIRKLDVLNYQTMHAIGLLQLKDPLKLILMPKSTVQYAKPLVSQNLWPRKAQKHISDPMLKLVHELHRDLELVYVGQVCLSWEILCWQHKKVQDLKQYDSQWPRRYNLVAGEFQLFQVFMQRFIEDEPFQQGTRIHNYVKNRCVIRNLLQVPAIKDDNTKNKKIIKWGEEDAIASERLAHIIKESMQVFWEFVKADKDYGNGIHKVSHQTGTDVKDTEISDLLRDIGTQLQKKERKLKDIVRSGNCIVRKFQKHHEDQIQLDHEQLLAQVGLRLISRVVHMKKLRKDQLTWCNEKLNRIKFVGRKVQVEPSFLLFPC